MTWVRLDDTMPEHAKIAGLSNAAFRLHIEGLCYCARNLSDGAIPRTISKRMSTPRAASELVNAGVWRATESGYEIHDYTQYQPTREEVLDRRQKRAEAGRRGAEARWRGDGKPDGKPHSKPHGKTDAVAMANQMAKPCPDPTPTAEEVKNTSSAPRERDPIWDAFVASLGAAPATTSGRGAWNAAAKQLRDIHIDPALISHAVSEHQRLWPNIEPVTPTSIAKHWTTLTATHNGHAPGETRLARARRVSAEREGATP